MEAEIARPDGPEKRVGDRVEQDVTVGMTLRTEVGVDGDAAELQRLSPNQPVNVVTLTDPKHHPNFEC